MKNLVYQSLRVLGIGGIVVFSSLSCTSESKDLDPILVEYKGALKNMMHQGDISAKISLEEFEGLDNFYALGAVENLKGEIQIFDSKVLNTSVEDSIMKFDDTFSKKATLLVYTTVKKWKEFEIPTEIKTLQQLDQFIEDAAKEYQIPVESPFPFRVKGLIDSLDWHVIDWKEGDMEHNHAKHKSSGLQGTVENQDIEILGFYSNSHHTIFTHHSTNMHMHFKTSDNGLAGHTDDLVLGEKMKLFLPAN